MVEQAISDLYFTFETSPDGSLGIDEVAKLNRFLLAVYEKEFQREGSAPPAQLPPQPIRFPDFRLHLHRAVAGMTSEAPAKERLVRHLIDIVRSPDKFVFSQAEENRTGIFGRLALSPPARGAERPLAAASPEPPAVASEGPRPSMQDAAPAKRLVEVPLPATEDAACRADGGQCVGQPPAGCWMPPATETEPPLQQQLRGVLEAVREAATGERARQSLETARSFGQLALERSMQALELAKEYGNQAFATQAPGVKQAMCEELGAGDGGGACDRLARLRRQAAEGGAAAGASERPLFQPPSPERPKAAEPPSTAAAVPTPARAEPRTACWRYEGRDGLHIDVRAAPELNAPRTGYALMPGEEFPVAAEHRGPDGTLFLRLRDGRGWVFESKPGVGTMCTRVA